MRIGLLTSVAVLFAALQPVVRGQVFSPSSGSAIWIGGAAGGQIPISVFNGQFFAVFDVNAPADGLGIGRVVPRLPFEDELLGRMGPAPGGAVSGPVMQANHREAPLIQEHPHTDITDVYAFISPRGNPTNPLLATYVPITDAISPAFNLGDGSGIYEGHYRNNSAGIEDFRYDSFLYGFTYLNGNTLNVDRAIGAAPHTITLPAGTYSRFVTNPQNGFNSFLYTPFVARNQSGIVVGEYFQAGNGSVNFGQNFSTTSVTGLVAPVGINLLNGQLSFLDVNLTTGPTGPRGVVMLRSQSASQPLFDFRSRLTRRDSGCMRPLGGGQATLTGRVAALQSASLRIDPTGLTGILDVAGEVHARSTLGKGGIVLPATAGQTFNPSFLGRCGGSGAQERRRRSICTRRESIRTCWRRSTASRGRWAHPWLSRKDRLR